MCEREREKQKEKKKKKEVFNIVSLVKTSYRKGKYLVLIPNQFQRSRSLEIGFRGRKKTTKNLEDFLPSIVMCVDVNANAKKARCSWWYSSKFEKA